jgi:hypothetical protein
VVVPELRLKQRGSGATVVARNAVIFQVRVRLCLESVGACAGHQPCALLDGGLWPQHASWQFHAPQQRPKLYSMCTRLVV